jgi:hypothetical protein
MKKQFIFLLKKYILKLLFLLINIFLILKNINKNKELKVCLCTIGKKENLYASEFVEHYKKIGYDKIFIYDNNDIGDERFEDVLNKQISSNFVQIINYRGYRGKRQSPQSDAFIDCYEKNKNNYDWLSFFDFDEFLEINKNKNIKEYLNNKIFKKCANIKINWLMFSDNDLLYYENIPVQKRFTTPLYHDNANIIIKSTVRGNLKFNYWRSMNNPHSSSNYLTACNSMGNITNPTTFYSSPFNHEYSYLKHYPTKTIQEYCNKMKKGRADLLIKIDNKTLENYFNYFFERNKKTKKKIEYFNKCFNFTIS